jgi:hypothetical protein
MKVFAPVKDMLLKLKAQKLWKKKLQTRSGKAHTIYVSNTYNNSC